MIFGFVALALVVWWLTGSLWPAIPVWVGVWLIVRTAIWGEVITDWHQPVIAGGIAAVIVALPRICWNMRRNHLRAVANRPLGVSFRTG